MIVLKKDFKLEQAEQLLFVCNNIEELYQKILDFIIKNRNLNTMAEFDMKTASSLLPVMTGDEKVTKKLIDSFKFYSQEYNKGT